MNLFNIAKRFPPVRFKAEDIQRELYILGINLDARKWITFILFVFFTSFLLLYLLTNNLLVLLISIFISIFLYYYPFLERMKYERELERDMPIFLRDLGSMLNMKIPFLRAINLLTKHKTPLHIEMRRVLNEVRKGSSLLRSLGYLATRLKSNMLKRSIAQIISAYETGSGTELKRMSNELLNVQRYKLREFGAKNALYGQVFVLFSVVAPAFFVIISVIGPYVFHTSFSTFTFTLTLLILFPALSYLILILSKMSLPTLTFKSTDENNYTTLFLALILTLLFLSNITFINKMIILILLILGLSVILIKNILKIRKIETIEKNLPDALLLISTMPTGTHLIDIIKRIAFSNIPGVSDEFKKVYRQIRANINPEKALDDLVKSINSQMLERMIDVLYNSFHSGTSINKQIAEIADDIISYFEIRREQSALLATQKYTLIFGLILVPIILGISIGLSKQLLEMMEVSKTIDLNYLLNSSIPAYFIVISAVIANYLGYIDGNKSSEILYFSLLSFISNFLFFLVLRFNFIH